MLIRNHITYFKLIHEKFSATGIGVHNYLESTDGLFYEQYFYIFVVICKNIHRMHLQI